MTVARAPDRAQRRRALAYAVTLALAVLLLAAGTTPVMTEFRRGVGFAMAPVQGVLSGATRSVTSVFGAIAEIDRLRTVNRDYQGRLQALEVENRRYTEIRHQYQQLTEILGVQSILDYETVAAEVIGREVSESERAISLGSGSDQGIAVGDVVVGSGAQLVGRVVEVGRNFSRVILISDTRSTVIGRVESSRAEGEVQGQLARALVMSKIPATDKVAVNDIVVTAGIDLGQGVRSPFPKGLVIGRVVEVRAQQSAVVQTAFLAPLAQLDKLEYVLVITDYEGGAPIEPPTPRPGASPTPDPSVPPGTPTPTISIPPNESPIVLPTSGTSP